MIQPLCEEYFGESEASPSVRELNESVRAYAAAVRDYLLTQHDAGSPALVVMNEHTELIDRLIRRLFRLAEDRYFQDFPRLNFRLAIVAVGGYGRSELSLGSDIDLLFLYRGKLNPYVETIAESLTQRLWDARFVVGGAARNLTECLRVGREDLPTLTSYMDMRFLVGDPELYAELHDEVRSLMREDAEPFVLGKLDEQRRRHEEFGESLYLLQPNLRESVGGLRDYHTALWVARAVQWDVRKVRDLRVHGFIDDQDLEDLSRALDFLWRVRNQLHRKGRKDDRLHYVAQEQLADFLGFEHSENLLAVERLMREYYVQARVVERVSRHVIVHALGLLDRRKQRRAPPTYAVAEGFAVAGAQLEIPRDSLLVDRPIRMLAAFAIAQHHDVDISVRTQRMLRHHLDLIDDEFREDPAAADLFKQILAAPTRVYRSLKLMAELGVLGAYIPEFSGVVGLWLQDLYHTYTVDVHSLFLIEELRRVQRGRYREKLPLATKLIREVQQPWVLFLGCLLHDIGKGRGGGHSEKGAQLIPTLARRLHLAPREAQYVQFIVRHHLTMNAMAERRNVHDPRVILRLANLARSREQLRILYLATVADIRSVSREAWTSWKAGILDAFYRNAAEWLEAGGKEAAADEYFLERTSKLVSERQHDALEQLVRMGGDRTRAEGFLDAMPRRYLISHNASEIASQMRFGLEFVDSGKKLGAYIFRSAAGGLSPFCGLVLFARDQRGLFSTTAGVIAALGHDVLGAQAYTSRNGLAVDIFQLTPMRGGTVEEEHERGRIEDRLRSVLEEGKELITPKPRWGAERRVGRARPPGVHLANEDSDFYTIIDVVADDRPGLLYDITRSLTAEGLDVVMSLASTRAHRVVDVFYITEDGSQITDSARRKQIANSILRAIEPPSS